MPFLVLFGNIALAYNRFVAGDNPVLQAINDMKKVMQRGIQNVNQKIEIVDLKIERAFGSNTSLSAAGLGNCEIEKLKANNLLRNFQPTSGQSVLTMQENEELKMIQTENEFVQYINAKLRSFLCSRAVYSSEMNPWLFTQTRDGRSMQKPNAFVCYRGFVKKN